MRRTGSLGMFEKTPGPGTYRLPSDFGYYESKAKSQEKNEIIGWILIYKPISDKNYWN